MTSSLTLACTSKILARLQITSAASTWIRPVRLSKTWSITRAPTANFGFPTFAKMLRPCYWWTPVLSLFWNCATETWLFSALRLISALGSKCSILPPITPPSKMCFTFTRIANSKLQSKSACLRKVIASRLLKIWLWKVQPVKARPSLSLNKTPSKIISERAKALCLIWLRLHFGWRLPIPLSSSSTLQTT